MAYNRFFSCNVVTGAGDDLIDAFETASTISGVKLNSLTLISDAELNVSINGGEYSPLFLDADAKYKLTIPPGVVLISSLITQEAGANVWMAAGF